MSINKPLISVLLPVYNGEEYLFQAIESVINQTYKNIELLIIDDKSTDGSLDIINSFDDKRIKLLTNKKNIGQTATLNRGIDLCYGEYIARLDQDDYFHPNKLTKQIEELKKSNSKVVGTWSYGINNNEVVSEIRHPIKNKDIRIALIIRQPFVHSSLLFKKDALLEVNKYPEHLSIAMDYGLLVNLAIAGIRFSNVPEFLTYLRFHDSSSSKKRMFDMERETYFTFKNTSEILDEKDIDIYKAIQFYRLVKLIKFFKTNYRIIIKVFIDEFKFVNIFYLIKFIIINGLIKNSIIFPTRISSVKI